MKKAVGLQFVLMVGWLLLCSQVHSGDLSPAKADIQNKLAASAGIKDSSEAKSSAENPRVVLSTEMGDIVLELFSDKAPVTVDNFIKNINNYHYDGLIFHRVIKGFMIQSGGHTFDLSFRDSGREPIINEAGNGLSNIRGSIAMARIADPDSAQAQFFINHKNNRRLDRSATMPGYAVFGSVVSGMDVVDAIASVKVRSIGIYDDVPVTPIRILKARLLNPKAWTALPEPKSEPAFEMPVPLYLNK
jgi:peptidyl-prolyl cis-trans isomerase A (cyclophilin A)